MSGELYLREIQSEGDVLILVDADDKVLGYETKKNVHLGQGQLHRAFSIFLVSPCFRVLLQKRSAYKPLWPHFWANTVCSHPRRGEHSEAAARRRLVEELGVSAELDLLFEFSYSATFEDVGSENELCKVFAGCIPLSTRLVPDPAEIEDLEWVTIEELESRIDQQPQQFTPWLKLEWERIRNDDYRDLRWLIEKGNQSLAMG